MTLYEPQTGEIQDLTAESAEVHKQKLSIILGEKQDTLPTKNSNKLIIDFSKEIVKAGR
jgi:hypothetical protein